MGKGSAWSDEVVYRHDLVQAAFTVSDDELAAADTLVLTAASRADGLDYAWDFDGGKAIKASADSALVWLTFSVPGEKHLRLTVTNPADGTEDVREKVVTVQRVSFERREAAAFGFTESRHFWDMDGDDVLDVIDKNGFYVHDGAGRYEKLGTIFNSNLQIPYRRDGLPPFLDFDMDGDADIVLKSNKGNLILNNGNNSFEAQESSSWFCVNSGYTSEVMPDLNNDGFNELYYDSNAYGEFDGICVNSGDNVRFEQFQFPKTGNEYNFRFSYQEGLMYDINRDGYLDFYSQYASGVIDNAWYGCEAIAINQGGMDFAYHIVSIDDGSDGPYRIFLEDMDSDGMPDKVMVYGNRSMMDKIVVCFGNKDYTFSSPVEYVFGNAHSTRYAVNVLQIRTSW